MTAKPKTPKTPKAKPAKPVDAARAKDMESWHPLARKFEFLARERFQRRFIWVSIIGLGLMIVAGIFFPLHKVAPWDFFASWAVIGIAGYCLFALASFPLFRLLGRHEDYYAEDWDGQPIRDLPPEMAQLNEPAPQGEQDA